MIWGSAFLVPGPRPLMWKMTMDPGCTALVTPSTIRRALTCPWASPDTTSHSTIGRPPVCCGSQAGQSPKGGRNPTDSRSSEAMIRSVRSMSARACSRGQLRERRVIVGVVAELDQRLGGQGQRLLAVRLHPPARHEHGGRHLLAPQDLEHLAVEAARAARGGAGVEGQRHHRLAGGHRRHGGGHSAPRLHGGAGVRARDRSTCDRSPPSGMEPMPHREIEEPRRTLDRPRCYVVSNLQFISPGPSPARSMARFAPGRAGWDGAAGGLVGLARSSAAGPAGAAPGRCWRGPRRRREIAAARRYLASASCAWPALAQLVGQVEAEHGRHLGRLQRAQVGGAAGGRDPYLLRYQLSGISSPCAQQLDVAQARRRPARARRSAREPARREPRTPSRLGQHQVQAAQPDAGAAASCSTPRQQHEARLLAVDLAGEAPPGTARRRSASRRGLARPGSPPPPAPASRSISARRGAALGRRPARPLSQRDLQQRGAEPAGRGSRGRQASSSRTSAAATAHHRAAWRRLPAAPSLPSSCRDRARSSSRSPASCCRSSSAPRRISLWRTLGPPP